MGAIKRSMDIIITQWALDSYLDLMHSGAFSATDYRATIRPNVLLLKVYPNHPKFSNGKFWSIATFEQEPAVRRIQDEVAQLGRTAHTTQVACRPWI
jgi:hypothetical protein